MGPAGAGSTSHYHPTLLDPTPASTRAGSAPDDSTLINNGLRPARVQPAHATAPNGPIAARDHVSGESSQEATRPAVRIPSSDWCIRGVHRQFQPDGHQSQNQLPFDAVTRVECPPRLGVSDGAGDVRVLGLL